MKMANAYQQRETCLLILKSFSAALKWLLQTTQGDVEMCIQSYCGTSNGSGRPSFPKLHTQTANWYSLSDFTHPSTQTSHPNWTSEGNWYRILPCKCLSAFTHPPAVGSLMLQYHRWHSYTSHGTHFVTPKASCVDHKIRHGAFLLTSSLTQNQR